MRTLNINRVYNATTANKTFINETERTRSWRSTVVVDNYRECATSHNKALWYQRNEEGQEKRAMVGQW
jgi:hypothetical protein